jgi:hypothetical protein
MPDPAARGKWVQPLFGLNALLDRGEHLDIAKTSRYIQDGTVFGWLKETLPTLDLSLNVPKVRNGHSAGSVQDTPLYPFDEMTEVLQRIDNTVDTLRKFGVKNNGIAMLVAYGLEATQQGA